MLAGNGVYAACQWGMLVVLTQIGSPEMVGQFALGLAVTAPVILLSDLQLRTVLATDVKRQYKFGDYLGLKLITTALALLFIAGIVLLLGYTRQTALVVLSVGIAKAIESISYVFYGLLQQHEQMDRIGKSIMIKGLLSLLALGVVVYQTSSVFWGVVGLCGIWAAILVSYDIRSGTWIVESILNQNKTLHGPNKQKLSLRPRWERKTLLSLTRLALPLGLVTGLIALIPSIPRYFVDQYWGAYELGIFAAIAYFERAGAIAVNALGQSAIPRLAKYFALGDRYLFRKLLLKLMGIGALFSTAGILTALLAGKKILTFIYQPEYARQDVFVLVMVAAGITYISSFFGYALTAARYFKIQILLFALSASSVALACMWLIPSEGLRGAAKAMIVAPIVWGSGCLVVIIYLLFRKTTDTNEA